MVVPNGVKYGSISRKVDFNVDLPIYGQVYAHEYNQKFLLQLKLKFTRNNPYFSSQCTLMDVNNDGIINVIDIVSTVNIIFDVSSHDNQQLCAADANQDGIINVIDIVTIVNYIFSLL